MWTKRDSDTGAVLPPDEPMDPDDLDEEWDDDYEPKRPQSRDDLDYEDDDIY